jgi:choloylglycine hydrolase
VGVLQWIQYQLDNCSNVEEVIATDKKLRISSKGTSPLHYLIADANGHAASIEFFEGKMLVHTGSDLPFPVLTNSGYAESLRVTGIRSPGQIADPSSFSNSSIDRFAKACYRVNAFQEKNISVPVIDYAFSILDEVAQSNTKWSIVYDIANKKIWFRTTGFAEIKELSFSSLDLNCKTLSKAGELNQHFAGDISSRLINFTDLFNRKIVEKSFADSRQQFTVTDENLKKIWQYPGLISCRN